MLIYVQTLPNIYICATTPHHGKDKFVDGHISDLPGQQKQYSEYLVDICNLYLLETDGTNIVAKHWYLQSDTKSCSRAWNAKNVRGWVGQCHVPRATWAVTRERGHVIRWYGDNQSAPVTRTRQYGYDAMLPVISEIYHTTSGKCRDSHGISRRGASMFGHMVILSVKWEDESYYLSVVSQS